MALGKFQGIKTKQNETAKTLSKNGEDAYTGLSCNHIDDYLSWHHIILKQQWMKADVEIESEVK